MKIKVLSLSLLCAAAFSLTSCDKSEVDNTVIEPYKPFNAYIVNNGAWGQNNGTISALTDRGTDLAKIEDIYYTANAKGIGDAQDAYYTTSADGKEGRIFVTSTTSDKITILSAEGKELYTRKLNRTEPRYITGEGENVYFTAYNGKLYKMNKNTYALTDSVEVGATPEALTIANGKIYVALSNYNMDGNGKYLAVVDLTTFKKTKNIEVALNPYNQMISVGNKVFFVCNLDYSDNELYVLDATTDKITKIDRGSSIAYDERSNSLVYIVGVYGHPEWNGIYRYDLASGNKQEIKLSAPVPNPGQVSVDPQNGDLYIVNTVYTGPSELYVYDTNGTFKHKLVSGYYTQQVIFLK